MAQNNNSKRNFKVIDTFIFFDELELLDLRFKELYDLVDRFIIIESKATFTNKPKELVFEKNKQQFSQYLDKITYIKIEDPPLYEDPWKNEEYQRNCIKEGLKNCQDNDIILLSDVDEIPNLRNLNFNDLKVDIFVYRMDLYYYYINTKQPRLWHGSIGIRYNKLKSIAMNDLRKSRNRIPNIIRGGWHFSYLGGIAKIQKKIESYAETTTNTDKYNNREYLEKSLDNNKDYYFDEFKLQEMNLKEINMPASINSFIEKYPFFYKNKDQDFHASCVFITTNSKNRAKWMEIAEQSIWDCNADLINEFIMCVDMIGDKDENGHSRELLNKEYYDKYSKKGWKVLFNNFNNVSRNQKVGFETAKNNFIFYCEDRAKINHIPTLNCVRKMHLMYRFGAIMYNCHQNTKCIEKINNGNYLINKKNPNGKNLKEQGELEKGNIIKYINEEKNYINVENSTFFRKNVFLCDELVFVFPNAIFNKKMINQMYDRLFAQKKELNPEKELGGIFVNFNLHNVFSLYNIINEVPPQIKNREYKDVDLNKFKCMEYEYRYNEKHSWFLRTELKKKIFSFVDRKQQNNILEIGCYEGLSSVFFADNLLNHPNSSMICVDPFMNDENNDHSYLLKSNEEQNFDHNIKSCNNSEKIKVCKMTSDEFFKDNTEHFSFIYIDGCHKPDYIIRDMENSFKFLKNKGVMWMDDYGGGDGVQIKNTMNSFLEKYKGKYDLIHKGYQLGIRKNK